ncbi:MAG: DEAD/DEAH box helicase [Planctomycetes bacterium]|nr:DEAD/DEAH box helicase [Planctomycetota bacterium]
MDIYDRYAPFIQDFIYQNNWQALRAIQVAAGDAIFNTDEHVLLSAATASGKTEAAFFPILTLFTEDPPKSIGALYIGPLKALINDQFGRLNDLCREAGVPVWHWHGDVGRSHKQRLLQRPSGILQITPESLEALLLRKHADIARLFGDLRFIVIDEVHSLLRGDRGGQTLCLIERLSRLAGVTPRRIGLSATIGDPESTGKFLAAGTGRGTVIPAIESRNTTWRLSMEHFFVQGEQAATDKEVADALPVLDDPTDCAPRRADPGLGYIFEHTRGKKCLVFANTREDCEAVTTTLRQYCAARNESDRFLIHHGNLSASYRETAEAAMKDEEQFQTTVTTATLELGIDIGRLERAFQIDAPFTVSSFLQRMGRTGRRELPPEMWFVMREDEPEVRAMLPATIPWKLLQGIALVQLYREERWVEPPKLDRLPFSLLYHQTMSTLASGGEMSPAALASRVLSLSYFHRIDADDYRLLLRHLLATEHIQKTERGGLIVGLAGERITNSFKFYAVFKENEEYTVRSRSQELGTIVAPPPVGEKIALAGHVWIVEEVDHKRHLIYCDQVQGKVPAYFGLCPGDIHTRILEKMRTVLREDTVYPYLMRNAVARLAEARHTAAASGLTENPLINLGGDMWCLFPWLGTYAFIALERFLKRKCAARLGLSGLDASRPYFLQFTMKATREEFFSVLAETEREPLDPMELVYPGEVPLFEKYDEFLPEVLVQKGFAHGILGIDEMRERIRGWAEQGNPCLVNPDGQPSPASPLLVQG